MHRVAGWTDARWLCVRQYASSSPRSMRPFGGSPSNPAVVPSGRRSRTREVVQPMLRVRQDGDVSREDSRCEEVIRVEDLDKDTIGSGQCESARDTWPAGPSLSG